MLKKVTRLDFFLHFVFKGRKEVHLNAMQSTMILSVATQNITHHFKINGGYKNAKNCNRPDKKSQK